MAPNPCDEKISAYPKHVQLALTQMRARILQLAADNTLGKVEQTLKWGELSFSVKNGSPIRLDWKDSQPHNYYLYFNCQSKLVDTFKELYSRELEIEGNRAIVLSLSDPIEDKIIDHCLTLALTYHKVKHLPLLGA
jgi:hypothetical protein